MAMTQFTTLTPDQFEAIGHIAVNWADLEVMFMYALWGVCKLDYNQGRVLTTHMSHLSRVGAIKTILDTEYSGQPLEAEMLEFIDKSEKLRNIKKPYRSWTMVSSR